MSTENHFFMLFCLTLFVSSCIIFSVEKSLGYGQVVRHRFLVPCIAGSNPAIPANEGGERLLAAFFVALRSGIPEYGTL